MNATCIIPARGGSKGIFQKNVVPLCGKPLLAWTIEAALASEHVQDIYVTTDDTWIGKIAQIHGANVIWRPEELAGDTASSESALVHALQEIGRGDCVAGDRRLEMEDLQAEYQIPRLWRDDDILVFLQCTSPLTASEDIDGVVEKLIHENADSALSVTASHKFLWRNNKSSAEGINHDKRFRPRRQDMEPQFAENGAIYAMRIPGFLKAKHRFFGETALYEIPSDRSWEIDEPIDLQIAEFLLRKQLEDRKKSLLPQKISAVVFDFDGVLTDNKVYQNQDGSESVLCSRSDGMGMRHLQEAGIIVLILSSEENPVVAARAKKLKAEVIHGSLNKAPLLEKWLQDHTIDSKSVIFVGNDLNDIEPMKLVGCPVAVADAHPEAKRHAVIVLGQKGGDGAARELSDLILSQKGS